MNEGRVVVIGGGVHGSAAATHLARAGFDVTVLEKQHTGHHASGVNAGGVRRLGRHPAEIPLSVAAHERWQRLPEIIGDDGGFRPCGQIKVAESDAELEQLEARAAEVRDLGFTHEVMLSKAELRRRLPSLNSYCPGALACDGDGAADPWQTAWAWRRQARREGVHFIEHAEVVRIEPIKQSYKVTTASPTSQGQPINADLLVNCAGAWAGEISDWLGEYAPVKREALMLSVTERIAPFIEPVVGATARPLSFKQSANGTVIIGGGFRGFVDYVADQAEVTVAHLASNFKIVIDLFPTMRDVRIVRTWAGLEAVMPDDIPVLGRSSRHANVIHSFGYSGHGFQLSTITGEIVRDLALGREPALPIAPFSIDRFQAGAKLQNQYG
jgi:sarcosine oxidase subunit beta